MNFLTVNLVIFLFIKIIKNNNKIKFGALFTYSNQYIYITLHIYLSISLKQSNLEF